MKFPSTLIIFSLLVVTAYAMTKEDIERQEEMAKKMITECQREIGGKDEDWWILMNGGEVSESGNKSCMLACVYEKMGAVSFNFKVTKSLNILQ